MKFENFEQAKSITEQIEQHKQKLDMLNLPINVAITLHSGGQIYNIPIDKDLNCEYSKEAKILTEKIKIDLEKRIKNLKLMLKKL